jgi:anti-sigma factor RsiW
VKPWFAGKLDFAPPVVVFADGPFTLLGGRIDYLQDRVVAALVYGHQKPVINLFVWPSSAPAAAPATREGYNLLNWTRAGLTFWAVSDAEPTVLRDFQRAFSAATPE